MAKRAKRIACFSLCSLILCMNFLSVKAEALPEVMSGSTTLADNIMTYYALSGSAVANSDWINTLYSSYGSSFGTIEELAQEGYLVLNDAGMWEPVQELGQMIEQAPAYSSLGLNDMFNVSAQEVAAGGGFAAASGGSILAGSLGGVASTGIVPLFGGVTAAYWGGIALGTLIAHGTGLYGKAINNGAGLDVLDWINSTQGNCFTYYKSGSDGSGKALPNGSPYCFYYDSSSREYSGSLLSYVGNGFTQTVQGYSTNFYNGNTTSDNFSFYNGVWNNTWFNVSKNNFSCCRGIHFNSRSEMNAYINGLKNGTQTPPKISSPDLIGENGNLEAQEDNGNITVPDMKPQIDPGTQAGKPLTLPDWLAFANAVQNNNNNTAPSGSPDNATLFDNILDLIRSVIPENVPNPNPNPNPDPWSPPIVTPVPDPEYPDPVPDQQITENPQESENPQQTENPIDTGKPYRLPDLRNKFPFCIPWDIAKVFSKLKVNARQAPHISWRFNPPNTPIDYTFNLDLEDFEEVATLLRTLELLGFIVGLAFATRYLIGAN